MIRTNPTSAELADMRRALTRHPETTAAEIAAAYGSDATSAAELRDGIGIHDAEPMALMGAAEGPESEPHGAEIIGAGASLATEATVGAWYAYAIREGRRLREAAYWLQHPATPTESERVRGIPPHRETIALELTGRGWRRARTLRAAERIERANAAARAEIESAQA